MTDAARTMSDHSHFDHDVTAPLEAVERLNPRAIITTGLTNEVNADPANPRIRKLTDGNYRRAGESLA
ncbi:MAG TPA: hypothetical protein VMB83_10420 [Roseiarcus sp.]|nr:hypothetical protein [Roseiarcus sp.]